MSKVAKATIQTSENRLTRGTKVTDFKFKVKTELQGHFQGQKGQKPICLKKSGWFLNLLSTSLRLQKIPTKATYFKFKVIIDLQGHFQGHQGQNPNLVRTSKILMF